MHVPSEPTDFIAHAYSHSRSRLCTLAARYVADDAEDLVQDVFVKALERAESFRRDSTPATWLHRITVNSCIDHFRRYRNHRLESLDAAMPVGDHVSAPDPFERAIVRAAMQTLHPIDRRLCVMRFVLGCSYQDMARAIAMPIGTVKSRLSVTRRRLRQAIEDGRQHTNESHV